MAFAGHDSGLGEDLSTRTAANGTYRINGVPAPHVGASWPWRGRAATTAPGSDVPITAGRVTRRATSTLRRNWALGLRRGQRSGRGPGRTSRASAAARARPSTAAGAGVWSTHWRRSGLGQPGAKELVIALPAAITLGEVRIDPSSGCGDPPRPALAGYQVQVSANAALLLHGRPGHVRSANVGRTNSVALSARPPACAS